MPKEREGLHIVLTGKQFSLASILASILTIGLGSAVVYPYTGFSDKHLPASYQQLYELNKKIDALSEGQNQLNTTMLRNKDAIDNNKSLHAKLETKVDQHQQDGHSLVRHQR